MLSVKEANNQMAGKARIQVGLRNNWNWILNALLYLPLDPIFLCYMALFCFTACAFSER
jgi:hypothetical protein